MAMDRWLSQDLPMLEAIGKLEDDEDRHFGIHDLMNETGFDERTVKGSLRRLEGEYVTFNAMPGDDDPLFSVRGIRLLGAARRATGQWPSPEVALAVLAETLTAAADQEPDEEQKSKLRKAAKAIGAISGDLATNIAATYLARISGIA